ncbi:hypothetical protein HYALB_00004491 [Hymenoscyphus albidus]|uniref:Uncharacterized protein n=1 Tax=Hymenoscyphus albidus TaxID=595503 RepID=A0A9N9LYW1_9HELO|nr:hypothetical protein HYALB_00004491 [Hymenoscyphus albidus]
MSTTSKLASKPDTPPSESSTPQKNTPLALPEVAHNHTQLDMSHGSTTVKLDHLGPMVVGADGTLSRITNWEGMTDGEKKATLRIIGKRNQERLKTLREKDVQG